MPKGEIVDAFYVIECRDWVCVAALTLQGELVLVRQYRHGEGAITLELPAGEIDQDEDPIAAARRELLEETGYRGGEARVVSVTSPNPSRYANRLHVVLIEGVEAGPQGQNDRHEATEAELWPVSAVRDLFLEPRFSNSSQAGGLAAALVSAGKL